MRTLKLKSNFLLALVALCSPFFLSSCLKDKNNNKSDTYLITGNASGSQMVPPVALGGSGTISGTYDSKSRVLTYTSTWTGLSGIPTSAGLYSGPVGVNGNATGSPWYLGLSAGSSGTLSGTVTLSVIQGAELIAGGLYYAYTTAANPGGEIRGQITATIQ